MKMIATGAGLLALFLALAPQAAGAAGSATQAPPPPPPAPPIATGIMPPGMAGAMGGPGMDSHIDGELAFLKVELKITDSQEREWDKFAKAAEEGGKEIADATTSAAPSGKITDSLDNKAKILKARLDVMEKLKDALDPLYKDLSDAQKGAADQLIPMHLNSLLM